MRTWLRIALWLLSMGAFDLDARADELPSQLRRPVDAIWLVPGRALLTANSRSGSLSVVDLEVSSVAHEAVIGGRPVGLVTLAENRLAVIDQAANQLRVVTVARAPWSVRVDSEVSVLRGPNSVVRLEEDAPVANEPESTATKQTLSVASLWDRSLEKIELDLFREPPSEVGRKVVQLPFAPRDQLVLPGGKKLLVADNHVGRLAVIDIESWTVDSNRSLNAHNIRGLALSEDREAVLIAHQILNQQVTTGLDAVRDGTLMQNVVRVLPLEKLIDPQALLPSHARTIFLGRAMEGAADPAAIVLGSPQNLCVALGGVDQLALVTASGIEKQRIEVGRRPTMLLPCPDRPEVVVLNTFSDSLTLVDTATAQVRSTISLGPQPELSHADRGEMLFYDGRLSFENWLSCHSCHTDGHANGLLSDTRGDGTAGTPKRILTLLGGRDANPWGWNGNVRILHEQVSKSIRNSMHGRQLPMTQINDMVAYLHVLEPAPPRLPATEEPEDSALLNQGRKVFEAAGCIRCHIPPLTYTSDSTYDVGIQDEAGHKLFNPPSLRGVSQRDSLFHDARAKTLEDVLEQGHFFQTPLTAEEQSALLRFLRSL